MLSFFKTPRQMLGSRNIWKVFRGSRSLSGFPATYRSLVDISEEVQQGFSDGKAIVALESTIITHGMPYPKNLETAQAVEQIVRDQGAVPATIAIVRGRIAVGLSFECLTALAQGTGPIKVSRRDLPRALAMQLDGGTTVAGTMILAARAGIHVFVTGGIGGVHRNGESTMDISADLTELGRTPVCVVSSGVKSILDIGRTLEYLETQGVCVVTYGDTTNFPAFYTRGSGFHSPVSVNTPQAAALMVRAALDLQLNSGLLVAVPVPEEFSLEEASIEAAIQESLKDAELKGIKGKDVTPFILAAVANITKGRSLLTNMALIKNNAKIGSQIAVELNKLKNSGSGSKSASFKIRDVNAENIVNISSVKSGASDQCSEVNDGVRGEVKEENEMRGLGRIMPVVVGGSNVDYTIKILEDDMKIFARDVLPKPLQNNVGYLH